MFSLLVLITWLVLIPGCKVQIAIDMCLDAGGAWDEKTNTCDTGDPLNDETINRRIENFLE